MLPRKIAAISITKRICYETGLNEGEIAHHVRFDSTVNEKTKLTLMTDGILVQKLYQDPLLQEYGVIVLDDIHERSINYEILFGMLKIILHKRRDLKLIITSATVEDKSIRAFFEKKKSIISSGIKDSNWRELSFNEINITGRMYPVQVHYLK